MQDFARWAHPRDGAGMTMPHDGVVVVAPVTLPYRGCLTRTAPRDIDGLAASSFTLAPDTAIG